MAAKRMSGEQRREQIITTAVDLFARKGFSDVTTREIAAAAGINEATIYKYFSSKEELFDAVVTHFGKVMLGNFEKICLDQEREVGKVYSEIAEIIIGFLRSDSRILRLMLYSGLQEHRFADSLFKQTGGEMLDMLQNYLRTKQEEGAVRKDLDVTYVSLAMIAMIIYYNLARILILKEFFKDFDDKAYVRTIVDILLNGISTETTGEKK
ncbi:MAG TPA: TetR/AcrR family transcriptional regulator [Acidobacteriota bacterium]|nr:TetR/AcrR family transcriptional regulator [Acidobacteriota bacterium]